MKISREEYLRLLSAAKKNNREREYLLIKAFALVGLRVSEVPDFTVELIKEGIVSVEPSRTYLIERNIPDIFRDELLAYAKKNSIETGPVFVTRTGKVIERTKITSGLKVLCEDSGVKAEKITPRALRDLYFDTVEEIHKNMIKEMTNKYMELVEKDSVELAKVEEKISKR